MDGVKRRSWKAKYLVDRSDFSPTSWCNGKYEVVEWGKREISLRSLRHNKKWMSVQSQNIVRSGGESGKHGAVKCSFQTDEGLDLLGETTQQTSHDDFKASKTWGY